MKTILSVACSLEEYSIAIILINLEFKNTKD